MVYRVIIRLGDGHFHRDFHGGLDDVIVAVSVAANVLFTSDMRDNCHIWISAISDDTEKGI